MQTYKQVKQLIACADDKAFYDRTYYIANEFGLLAIVYADTEQDALDSAVDNGLLNSEVMSPEDYAEYVENGWEDSYCHAGNASEPIWCEHLRIEERNRSNTL